jgi:hypothetical protein
MIRVSQSTTHELRDRLRDVNTDDRSGHIARLRELEGEFREGARNRIATSHRTVFRVASESPFMATIDADTLFPNERMRSGVSEGEVTQIHRGQQYADEGDRFEVDGEEFEVVEIRERTLGDMTDEDAQKEGMEDVAQYREMLKRAHDNFEWDPDSDVVLHRVEKVS